MTQLRSSPCKAAEICHLDVVRVWEHTGVQVPIVDVEDALREACKRWRVQKIVADPFRWARSLQLLADEGLPVEEFPQSQQRMTPATQRFGEAVLNRALTHSGVPDLARHVGNAVVKNDSRGHRIHPRTTGVNDSPRSPPMARRLPGVRVAGAGRRKTNDVGGLINGDRDPAALAELAKRRLRSKIPALTEALNGRFTDHHAFLARVHLDLIDRPPPPSTR